MKTLLTVLVVAGLTIGLAGCYSTDEPVIEKGECAPLEGTFVCDVRRNKTETVVYTEKKKGFLFPDYSYQESDGEETKVISLSENLYVAQGSKDGSYIYAYFDFINDDQFVVLAANLLAKAPYLENLAKQHGVETKPRGDRFARLTGDKEDIREFLKSHDKSLLMALSQCRRKAAS